MIRISTLLAFLALAVWPLSAQTTIFRDGFETGRLDPSHWTVRANLAGAEGFVEPIERGGYEDSWGVGFGKPAGRNDYATNALDLRLDLSGRSAVELSFRIAQRAHDTDEGDGIFLSDDGGASFAQVLAFRSGEWRTNTFGSYPPLDLAALAGAVGLELNESFVVRFQVRGNGAYGDNVDVSLDDVWVYDPGRLYRKPPFTDDFEAGELQNFWSWSFADASSAELPAFAKTSPMGLVEVIEKIGVDNSSAVAMGRRVGGPVSGAEINTNALDLHLDLAGQRDVGLSFRIAGISEETDADDGIYFSADGGTAFTKVLDFRSSGWTDRTFGEYPPLDVDELARRAGLGLTETFVVRFQQRDRGGYDSDLAAGFVLDDVSVSTPAPSYASLPYGEDFESGQWGESWTWTFAGETSGVVSEDETTSPMGLVEVRPKVGIDESQGLVLGRRESGHYSTNAIDLHLDLAGERGVELLFETSSDYDDTDLDDGLWFSDDGGATFASTLQFNTGEWCPNTYGHYPPIDVDELAAAAGLELTSTFVIRFQQRGSGKISGAGDGLYLDDVIVRVPQLTYAEVPFADNFNDAELDPAWAVTFPDATAAVSAGSATTSPMSYVGLEPALAEGQALALGRRCGNPFAATQFYTTAAIDLHLRLADRANVRLAFDLYDAGGDTDLDDGLWLSTDAGTNFSKIYSFDFESITDRRYQRLDLDLDSLLAAASPNLTLSDTSVLRFQQRGAADLARGGLYVDNLVVGERTSATTAPLVSGLDLFPVPVSDVLHVRFDASSQRVRFVDVYDAHSVRQWRRELKAGEREVSLVTSAFASGMYALTLTGVDGRTFSKLFLKR